MDSMVSDSARALAQVDRDISEIMGLLSQLGDGIGDQLRPQLEALEARRAKLAADYATEVRHTEGRKAEREITGETVTQQKARIRAQEEARRVAAGDITPEEANRRRQAQQRLLSIPVGGSMEDDWLSMVAQGRGKQANNKLTKPQLLQLASDLTESGFDPGVGKGSGQTNAQIAERIYAARQQQAQHFGPRGVPDAFVVGNVIREDKVGEEAQRLLKGYNDVDESYARQFREASEILEKYRLAGGTIGGGSKAIKAIRDPETHQLSSSRDIPVPRAGVKGLRVGPGGQSSRAFGIIDLTASGSGPNFHSGLASEIQPSDVDRSLEFLKQDRDDARGMGMRRAMDLIREDPTINPWDPKHMSDVKGSGDEAHRARNLISAIRRGVDQVDDLGRKWQGFNRALELNQDFIERAQGRVLRANDAGLPTGGDAAKAVAAELQSEQAAIEAALRAWRAERDSRGMPAPTVKEEDAALYAARDAHESELLRRYRDAGLDPMKVATDPENLEQAYRIRSDFKRQQEGLFLDPLDASAARSEGRAQREIPYASGLKGLFETDQYQTFRGQRDVQRQLQYMEETDALQQSKHTLAGNLNDRALWQEGAVGAIGGRFLAQGTKDTYISRFPGISMTGRGMDTKIAFADRDRDPAPLKDVNKALSAWVGQELHANKMRVGDLDKHGNEITQDDIEKAARRTQTKAVHFLNALEGVFEIVPNLEELLPAGQKIMDDLMPGEEARRERQRQAHERGDYKPKGRSLDERILLQADRMQETQRKLDTLKTSGGAKSDIADLEDLLLAQKQGIVASEVTKRQSAVNAARRERDELAGATEGTISEDARVARTARIKELEEQIFQLRKRSNQLAASPEAVVPSHLLEQLQKVGQMRQMPPGQPAPAQYQSRPAEQPPKFQGTRAALRSAVEKNLVAHGPFLASIDSPAQKTMAHAVKQEERVLSHAISEWRKSIGDDVTDEVKQVIDELQTALSERSLLESQPALTPEQQAAITAANNKLAAAEAEYTALAGDYPGLATSGDHGKTRESLSDKGHVVPATVGPGADLDQVVQQVIAKAEGKVADAGEKAQKATARGAKKLDDLAKKIETTEKKLAEVNAKLAKQVKPATTPVTPAVRHAFEGVTDPLFHGTAVEGGLPADLLPRSLAEMQRGNMAGSGFYLTNELTQGQGYDKTGLYQVTGTKSGKPHKVFDMEQALTDEDKSAIAAKVPEWLKSQGVDASIWGNQISQAQDTIKSLGVKGSPEEDRRTWTDLMERLEGWKVGGGEIQPHITDYLMQEKGAEALRLKGGRGGSKEHDVVVSLKPEDLKIERVDSETGQRAAADEQAAAQVAQTTGEMSALEKEAEELRATLGRLRTELTKAEQKQAGPQSPLKGDERRRAIEERAALGAMTKGQLRKLAAEAKKAPDDAALAVPARRRDPEARAPRPAQPGHSGRASKRSRLGAYSECCRCRWSWLEMQASSRRRSMTAWRSAGG